MSKLTTYTIIHSEVHFQIMEHASSTGIPVGCGACELLLKLSVWQTKKVLQITGSSVHYYAHEFH